MDCERKACRREYADLVRDGADECDVVHCGEENCHNIYLADRSGSRCDSCFSDACQACAADPRKGCDVDGTWYCVDCRDVLVQQKQLTRCQNRARDCPNYAHTREFACVSCGIAACQECERAVFGRIVSVAPRCLACKNAVRR